MPYDNSAEITVAGTGEVYTADVGATMPTNTTSVPSPASWFGHGLHSEEGATFTTTPEIAEFRAWQSRQAVRRVRTAQDIQVAFQLLQWNEENTPFAFGGGEITNPSPGVYKYVFPEAGDPLEEKAFILDVEDGDRKMRIFIPRGTVAEATETQFQATEMAVLPVTFKALKPTDGSDTCWILFDDAEAFAAGS